MAKHVIVVAWAIAAIASVPAFARSAPSPFMTHGVVADAPTGFVDFCRRDQYDCMAGHETHPIEPPTRANASYFPARVDPVMGLPGSLVESISARGTLKAPVDPWAIRLPVMHLPSWLPALELPSLPAEFPRGFGDAGSFTVASFSLARFDLPQADVSQGMVPLDAPTASIRRTAFKPAQATAESGSEDPALHRESIRSLAMEDPHAMLARVNAQVNRSIVQVYDRQSAGVDEYWQRPVAGRDRYGDCEDIAIEKRMQLVEMGFAPDRLFFAVAYLRGYGLHTVLVARLTEGDVVLDSMAARVLPWHQVGYVWVRLQSPDNPMVWTTIDRRSGFRARFQTAALAFDGGDGS